MCFSKRPQRILTLLSTRGRWNCIVISGAKEHCNKKQEPFKNEQIDWKPYRFRHLGKKRGPCLNCWVSIKLCTRMHGAGKVPYSPMTSFLPLSREQDRRNFLRFMSTPSPNG